MFLTFVMLLPQENLCITFHIKHDDQIKCVSAMFKDMFQHHKHLKVFACDGNWLEYI